MGTLREEQHEMINFSSLALFFHQWSYDSYMGVSLLGRQYPAELETGQNRFFTVNCASVCDRTLANPPPTHRIETQAFKRLSVPAAKTAILGRLGSDSVFGGLL